ncbi:unnamed protein product [Adineta steineri]|uniref:N-acetylgalactosaminide beta-1,3-galactosyltransferase n=1 Tax=Adineta steineri TaxID=433720 RepID=A0A813Q326_9BILA|nr:unnamed protein product [Adineta steineri]CAF3809705.1 unnamed protein product [Adineta steineri]
MMQRGKCRSPLYHRLLLSLILSISASLLLITITNQHQNSFLSITETNNIADRTVLFIRTAQNCQSRLRYLLESWIPKDLSKQSNIYLITDKILNSTNATIFNLFRNVVETSCPSTHSGYDLCCKTAHEFDAYYSLTKINSNLEWMCRFDDDQYVNVDNLYKYLSQMNSSKPYYIGRTSINKRLTTPKDNRTYIFATYGAGVCYSHTLLKRLRPHVHVNVLPRRCVNRSLSDDVYMGYLIELIVNVTLTPVNDLLHSHLEILDKSFRRYSLNDLARMITFGFAWDRYTLDWLPIIHHLIEFTKQDQYEAADHLWLFLRNYEKEHPQNLTNKYDQSCTSYERLRNKTLLLKNKTTIKKSTKKIIK